MSGAKTYKRITMEIPLCPRTKKNSQRIVMRRMKDKSVPIVIPSKAYEEYEKACGYFIKPKDVKIHYAVNVKCLYYMPTRRRVDLTNLLEATDDILVKYGVLEDDNFNIIAGHDGSRVYHDKDNPRTEIIIEAIANTDEW